MMSGRTRARESRSQGDEALVASFEQGGRGADEVFVDLSGAFAAFADGPDYEGLAAAHIAGGEDRSEERRVGKECRP